MAAKKDKQPAVQAEQQALEKRVDDMMDPTRPDPAQPASPKGDEKGLPPLDIFEGTKTAPDLPKGLDTEPASGKPAEATKVPETETAVGPEVPAEVQLDDPVSDAAIDEIVAEESDKVLEVEDASNAETQPQGIPEKSRKKVRHHPIFWAIVTIVAVLALLVAYLLASGGNSILPGSSTVQSWLRHLPSHL